MKYDPTYKLHYATMLANIDYGDFASYDFIDIDKDHLMYESTYSTPSLHIILKSSGNRTNIMLERDNPDFRWL